MPYFDYYGSPSYVPGAGLPPGIRASSQVTPGIAGTPQAQGGFDWNNLTQYLPAVGAAAGGLGLGALLGQRNPPATSYGNGGFLPGTAQLSSGLQSLGNLISQLQAAAPPGMTMDAVANASNRQNILQGLSGPGAATNTSNAVAGFVRDWNAGKTAQLAQLLGLQSDIGSRIQEGEERRRKEQAASQQAQTQAAQEQRQGLFRLLGTLLGAIVGGPAGAGIGGGLGGLAEEGLNSLGVFGPPPSY